MEICDKRILRNYLKFFEKLRPRYRRDLANSLSNEKSTETHSSLMNALGQWDSAESAQELIEDLRKSRLTSRDTEEI